MTDSRSGGRPEKGKAPAFQFYPGDWLANPAIRVLNVAARGRLFDALCEAAVAGDAATLERWRVLRRAKKRKQRRRPIPKAVKVMVFARDGYACRQCRAETDLQLDHIHPWSLGGTDEPRNLQVLCPRCNRRKGDRT